MGRPRKPTVLHVLQGTVNATRHAERINEPVIAAGTGDAPEYLDALAAAEWDRITAPEVWGRVVTAADRSALIDYCVLHSRMVQDAQGVRLMTASERQQLQSLRVQMGLTPAARSKVAAPAPEKPKSEWDLVAKTG